MGILRVKKKDGSEEDFDKGGVVSTDEIAAKVVESLLGVNLKASTSFEEYRKTKTSESN